MASNYTDVITKITNIATETVADANTAMRVGTAMSDMTALSAAMTGAINAGALTGKQQWATMQAMLTDLSGVGLPATTLTPGTMIGWRDVLMTAHLSRYVSGDPYQAGSWQELPTERYMPVVRWSGTTVSGVTVEQLGSSGDVADSVVLDTARPSFLYMSGGKYYAEWASRSQYQTAVVSGQTGDPGFVPAVFKARDGSVWMPTGSAAITKIVDEAGGGTSGTGDYIPVVKWSGTTVNGVEVVADTSMGGSDPAAVVLDTAKGSFLYLSGGQYYTWWTNAADYQENAWSSAASSWEAGFTRAVFSGQDGSLWWPSSASKIVKIEAGGGSTGAAYTPVVDWSGKVVSGVGITPDTSGSGSGEVVWDDGLKTFLSLESGAYYSWWPTANNYQDNASPATSSVAVAGVIEGVAQFSILPTPIEWMLSPVTVTADKVYVLMNGTSDDGLLVYSETPQSAGYLLVDNKAYNGASAWVDSSGQPLARKAYSAPDGRTYTPSYVAGQYRLAEWQAGLKARAVYRGGDGSVWIATSAGRLERIVAPAPDTSPYYLDASLASKWQMSALPDKTELLEAYKAGRPVRIADIASQVLMQFDESNPKMVVIVVMKFEGSFTYGRVVYSGTATTWGYDAQTYTEYEVQATSAPAAATDANDANA